MKVNVFKALASPDAVVSYGADSQYSMCVQVQNPRKSGLFRQQVEKLVKIILGIRVMKRRLKKLIKGVQFIQ